MKIAEQWSSEDHHLTVNLVPYHTQLSSASLVYTWISVTESGWLGQRATDLVTHFMIHILHSLLHLSCSRAGSGNTFYHSISHWLWYTHTSFIWVNSNLVSTLNCSEWYVSFNRIQLEMQWNQDMWDANRELTIQFKCWVFSLWNKCQSMIWCWFMQNVRMVLLLSVVSQWTAVEWQHWDQRPGQDTPWSPCQQHHNDGSNFYSHCNWFPLLVDVCDV